MYQYILFVVVNGDWSEWSEWEECNVSCGGGNKTRNRTCTEPEPQYGGDHCSGHDTNYTSCNDHPCPSMYYSLHLKKITRCNQKL